MPVKRNEQLITCPECGKRYKRGSGHASFVAAPLCKECLQRFWPVRKYSLKNRQLSFVQASEGGPSD